MKKKLVIAVSFILAFALGCLFGVLVQHLCAGYWHKVLKSESFPFPDGEVTLSYTAESIGMPFLDPETSVLTVKTEYGLPIIVYKAKRMFQESWGCIKSPGKGVFVGVHGFSVLNLNSRNYTLIRRGEPTEGTF